jgi:ANTAR domain
MTPSDEERLVAAFAGAGGAGATGSRLCEVCCDESPDSGVTISLEAGGQAARLCSSDDRSALLDDLQHSLGEGPSFEARTDDRPVVALDLGSPSDRQRWPSFSGSAVRSGVLAIVARPLQLGAARLGVLTTYQERSGPLSSVDERRGAMTARLLTRRILDLQQDLRPEELAVELAAAGDYRAEVHQATGMVSVQLGVAVDEALRRIRAHAYATGRTTSAVASDVVARRLRLEP